MFGSLNNAGNHIDLNICMPASCNALIAAGSFQARPLLEHLTISIGIGIGIGMGTATNTATAIPTQARPGPARSVLYGNSGPARKTEHGVRHNHIEGTALSA